MQGGEIALSRAGDLDEEELRELTLGGVPLAAAGVPAVAERRRRWSRWSTALRAGGFEILLAHPERSPTMMRSPEALERLLAHGAIAQVTSGSIAGDFGETVRRTAFAMLERGHVHVLASDGHHPTLRPPDLQRALEPMRRRYDDADDQFDWMALQAPRALLADEPLPARPPAPRPRGGLLRRFRA